MCDSHIHPDCTGTKEHELTDKRKVCSKCLPYVPGRQDAQVIDNLSSPNDKMNWGDNFCR
jgi:reverse gyrase